MSSFDIGDVVRLKSGGPKMTIVDVGQDGWFCTWFTEKGEISARIFFVEASLQKVEKEGLKES